jgi:hypothetical protein
VVTANNIFLRSLGSSLGVAVFGAIANATIGSSDQVDPGRLTEAVHHIFIALVVIAVVMAIAVSLMARGDTPVAADPVRRRSLRASHAHPPSP